MSAGLAVLAGLLACGSADPVDMDPDREPIQIVEDFTLVQSRDG